SAASSAGTACTRRSRSSASAPAPGRARFRPAQPARAARHSARHLPRAIPEPVRPWLPPLLAKFCPRPVVPIGPPSSFISLAPCISHARFAVAERLPQARNIRRRGTATTLRPQPEAEFQEFASPRGRATHHCRLARRALAGAAVRYDNELVE